MGLNEGDIRRVVWTFIEAFVGVFLVAVGGWGASPDFGDLKAAGIAALGAAIAAIISLLKNLVLGDGSSLK